MTLRNVLKAVTGVGVFCLFLSSNWYWRKRDFDRSNHRLLAAIFLIALVLVSR
jgi:hypothetical protein